MNNPSKAENNIASLPKNKCYGCAVCASICPENCIKMAFDNEGFYYPIVDEPNCIECRKCIDTCPGFNYPQNNEINGFPDFVAGYCNNENIRFTSSSGGFFSLIANEIITSNGVVYGAVYEFENMRVVHTRAENFDQILPMRKSKYVQSDTTKIFSKVKSDLNKNIPVLFSGTPCQVDGLNNYLEAQYTNLYTCDIICHGVPSPGLFQTHFSELQNQYNKKITNIDFRTKRKGWGGFLNLFLELGFNNKNKLRYSLQDPYYSLFLANLSLRPCCYQCPYTSTKRISDITLGDFWGVKKEHPDLFDRYGTSLLLVNTEKGKTLLSAIQSSAKLKIIDLPRPFPPNLEKPSLKPLYRNKIFKEISFEKWRNTSWKFHIISLLIIIKTKFLNLF